MPIYILVMIRAYPKTATLKSVIFLTLWMVLFSPSAGAQETLLGRCQAFFSGHYSPREAIPANPKALALYPLTTPASAELRRVQEVLDSGFAGFPEKNMWIAYPKRDPRTQDWVENLVNLQPEEREALLQQLKANPIKNKELRQIANLALYDRKAWHAYFDSFSAKAEPTNALIDSLVPVLRNMPEQLKQSLYDRIGPLYGGLSKLNLRIIPARMNLRLAPKRAMDAFIRNTMRSDEVLRNAVADGATPAEAYGIYLNQLRERIFHSSSTAGGYGGHEVLEAAKAVQEVLRKNADRFGKDEILLTGSFPNGRANLLKSDVDIMVSNPEIASLLGDFSAAANKSIRRRERDAKLEFHTMWAETSPNFAADINPLQIRISKDKIDLVVYGPDSLLHADKVRAPMNYPAPESYSLLAKPKDDLPAGPIRAGWPHSRGPPPLSATAPAMDPMAAQVSATNTILGGYPGFPKATKWMATPSAEPQVQKLVEALLNVSEKGRAELLSILERNPPKDSELDRIIKLALYDQHTWDDYYKNFSTRPQPNTALAEALTPVLERMPDSLKDRLQARIRADYPGLRKEKWIFSFPEIRKFLEFGPKRAVDVFIRHTIPAQPIFEEGMRAGKGIAVTYNDFLNTLRTKVFTGPHIGKYNAEEVIQVARDMQAVMRKQPVDPSKPKPSIVIAGSLPTGRARLDTSDIDLMPSHFSLEKLYPEMEKNINDRLRVRHPESKLELHSMFSTSTTVDAAIVSPVMIKVEADKIELHVYPNFRMLPGDKHYLPKNYEKPLVYELPSEK